MEDSQGRILYKKRLSGPNQRVDVAERPSNALSKMSTANGFSSQFFSPPSPCVSRSRLVVTAVMERLVFRFAGYRDHELNSLLFGVMSQDVKNLCTF